MPPVRTVRIVEAKDYALKLELSSFLPLFETTCCRNIDNWANAFGRLECCKCGRVWHSRFTSPEKVAEINATALEMSRRRTWPIYDPHDPQNPKVQCPACKAIGRRSWKSLKHKTNCTYTPERTFYA